MTDEQTRQDGYVRSDDRARLDFAAVHAALAASYWSPGIARETVERAAAGSLTFGLYAPKGEQVGYARVVTDRATFAYLADVYVLEAHRGRGLGRWLVEGVLAHPDLEGLRRWMLATRDAHGLYASFGFAPLAAPDRFMEQTQP
ncbi:MAG TPA: GNAT family N-acetyltransferase [Rubricoccaceae bacterium]